MDAAPLLQAPRRPLRTRLLGAFAAAVLIAALAVGTMLVQIREVRGSLEIISTTYLPLSRSTARMQGQLQRANGPVAFNETLLSLKSLLEHQIIELPEEANGIQACLRQLEVVADAHKRYEASLGTPAGPRAQGLLGESLDQLSDLAERRIGLLSSQTLRAELRAERISVAVALASLALVTALALSVHRTLRPVEQLTRAAQALALGEPLPLLSTVGDDEIAVLTQSFSKMALSLAERQRDRERLERAERLALLGQLLAEVTHEVRNPLNALSLHAELLADELADPEQRAVMGTMLQQIKRLETLTGRYLDLARPRRPEQHPIDPLVLVHDIVAFEADALENHGLAVQVRGQGGLLCLDPGALRQILGNLLRNAAEAGASSAIIEVLPETDALNLVVADDGPGMDPTVAERIFEPFFSTHAHGTGLGLAITRQLVEQAGGRIRCTTAPQSGTQFHVHLPAGVWDASDSDR